jgi:hypothetical protein
MGHDLVILTPGVQKGISQDRHVTPPSFLVDGLGQTDHETIVPGQDRRGEGDEAERVAEHTGDTAEGVALHLAIHPPERKGPIRRQVHLLRRTVGDVGDGSNFGIDVALRVVAEGHDGIRVGSP